MSDATLTRRRLLQALGLTGAAWFLKDLAPAFAAQPRDAEDPVFLIFATFDGGWDQLLALDPRDNTVWDDPAGPIFPAYDRLAAADDTLAALLAANPSGVVRPAGSPLSFGPAVGRLAEGGLHEELCVIRGINMGTLTHEVGRRYFLTGKFPAGLQASGSALATSLVAQTGDATPIPNLVVGLETYNVGLPNFASGLQVRSSADLQTVLTPLGTPLAPGIQSALDAYLHPGTAPCEQERMDGDGLVTQYKESRDKAISMVQQGLGGLFAFTTNPSDPAMIALNAAFHVSTNSQTGSAQLAGAAGQAMIAAQALTHGVSQAVSIKLAEQIDHHDDTWLTDHSTALRDGFNALADLITYLKNTTYTPSGKSFWSHTLLLCTSDFARTPTLNNRDGRDHHLASSCLLAGRGIKGNTVIGATDDETMGFQGIDLASGAVVGASGWVVRPPDVHATLLEAAGLDASHLENQSPVIIGAALA